jgi:serine protease AprX
MTEGNDEKSGPSIPAPELPGRPRLGLERATIPPALNDESRRSSWGLPEADKPGDYMVELNLSYRAGLEGAGDLFIKLYGELHAEKPPKKISKSYYSCFASLNDLRRLVKLDEDQAKGDTTKLAIYKVWPDFPIKASLDKSVSTVKADAAARSFAASGDGIVWAVIDSGVQADHSHFASNETLSHASVNQLHRNFANTDQPTLDGALVDEYGHGTHVAGIIAGQCNVKDPNSFAVYQRT